MDTFNFKKKVLDYSSKNIPIPGKESYFKQFIHYTESLLSRMRWGALFFLKKQKEKNEGLLSESDDSENDDNNETEKVTYGFNTSRPPPFIKEIADFEKDVWNMVETIKFTNHKEPFQNTLNKELKEINKSENVFMKADKTRNYYETKPETYHMLNSCPTI